MAGPPQWWPPHRRSQPELRREARPAQRHSQNTRAARAQSLEDWQAAGFLAPKRDARELEVSGEQRGVLGRTKRSRRPGRM
eukprot:scaffold20352_cov28-Tisochrysis_lutea.AAC.7